jgi:hypothetical protein
MVQSRKQVAAITYLWSNTSILVPGDYVLLRLKKRAADKREAKLIRDEDGGDDVEAAVGRILDIDDKNDVGEKQASSRAQIGKEGIDGQMEADTDVESDQTTGENEETWDVPSEFKQMTRIFEGFERIIAKSNLLTM